MLQSRTITFLDFGILFSAAERSDTSFFYLAIGTGIVIKG